MNKGQSDYVSARARVHASDRSAPYRDQAYLIAYSQQHLVHVYVSNCMTSGVWEFHYKWHG